MRKIDGRISRYKRKRKKSIKTRRLLAIGDLHGDFYRLVRILKQEGILSEELKWNTKADNVDLVFLGDYVDWRGEPLEGSPEEWPQGAKRVIDLLIALYKEVEALKNQRNFSSQLYLLLGNHDNMMWESYQVIRTLPLLKNNLIMRNTEQLPTLIKFLYRFCFDPMSSEKLMKVINWYEQGGEMTIASYGGLKNWLKAMDGEHGFFFRSLLRLGVVINDKLYSHSIPDHPQYWIPIEEWNSLPQSTLEGATESLLWGRRLWGFNVFTGMQSSPFNEEEIEEMLRKFGVKAAVVGHTPFFRDSPFFAYGGRIINIDTHGVPGSIPYKEEYVPSVELKRRKRSAKRLWKQDWKILKK